jgi:predicted ferric reductase
VFRRRLRCSYERWQLAHRALAVLVVVTRAAHALARLPPGGQALRATTCALSGAALGLLATQRVLRPLLLRRRPWEVAENRDEGASTRTLVLRAAGHAGLRFAPGQFVWLATPRRGLLREEHPLTIASSPELDGGRTLELAIKALGDWSGTVVPALRPGDRVRIDGPFGAFTSDGVAAERLVFVAGGVGVAPMRSMLLAMRDRGDRRPAVLFFAAHDRSRAMFAGELERLRSALDLELVFVFEAPGPGEACERGLLSAALLRRHLPQDLRATHVFVCGPAPMMAAFERIADELGLPPANVHTERYDLV